MLLSLMLNVNILSIMLSVYKVSVNMQTFVMLSGVILSVIMM